MIYLRGDTHIPIDIEKLDMRNFKDQAKMTRDDYVIVLGDFGLLWRKNENYRYWLEDLSSRNFTLLWLDGNHENHAWLDSLPVSEWHGGKVHKISDNIIHLMRGQIFSIENRTFFVMGGAWSFDQKERVPGISWWEREELSKEEEKEALANLKKYNFKVDYILTHTCSNSFARRFFDIKDRSRTGKFLDKVGTKTIFKYWFFGHHHVDKNFGNVCGGKHYVCIFNKVLKLP